MAALPSEVSVQVESSVEDAMMVSYTLPDGSLFRGALLKVKQWSVPSVGSGDTSSTDGATLEASSGAIAPTESTHAFPSVLSTAMADYAALQHRWSYLLQNVSPLPRKNLPSRRDRERLDQVPKLRPRNFVCTRCRYAMPGFSQPQTTLLTLGNSPSVELIPSTLCQTNPTSFSNGRATSSQATAIGSQSHIRKGKVPLKRPVLSRPLMETSDVADDTFTKGQTSQQRTQQDPTSAVQTSHGKRKKGKVEEKQGSSAVATILSAGDNSLKMKFKLTSPVPSTAQVPPALKRARTVKVAPAEEKPSSDDDDDDRPRLKIVDDSEAKIEDVPAMGEELTALALVVASSPPLTPAKARPDALLKTPVRERIKRRTEVMVTDAVEGKLSSSRPKTSKVVSEVGSNKPPTPSVPKERRKPSISSGPDGPGGAIPKPIARAVTRCTTKDNRHFAIGDIVWGKITGYPWWPGIIRHIVICDDPMLQKTAITPAFSDPQAALPILQYQEAQVEWYGQKSSISYIEVGQLACFKEEFVRKHKPKLRGSYQEAVKLAKQADQGRHHDNNGEESSIHEAIHDVAEKTDLLSHALQQHRVKLTDGISGDPIDSLDQAVYRNPVAHGVYDFD